MSIATENVRFGRHSGFLAWPERAASPLPAVLVLQEAWGVDAHIEDVTRRFAAAGYVALAPDLFAVDGARPAPFAKERMAEMLAFVNAHPPTMIMDPAARATALDAEPADRRARIGESMDAMFANFGKAPNLETTLAAARWLRDECPRSRGNKVGAVGFCMGGTYSALLAIADPELAGAVIFYGMAPPPDKVDAIRCPVLGFYGKLDARVNAGVPAFVDAMNHHGKSFEHYIYDGAGHAFFNDARPTYEPVATRHSFARTLAFFARTLE